MNDSLSFSGQLQPTAARPLLGLTILMVEDSRYACDAARLLCVHSGARLRRADCLASAHRHLEVYRPSVIIIDMGLPDGSGADLIRQVSQATPRISAILATSGDPFAEHCALAAGADGFLAKPLVSVAVFQNKILSLLPQERRPIGPRTLSDESVVADPIAYRDDMAHAAEVLSREEDLPGLDYAARFLSGVALSAGDRALADAADALFEARMSALPIGSALARLSGLVHERLEDRMAV
ncbi:KDP operon transcriptional regulatory protein KdpE [Roseivivax sp. THAF40]|uniref:response regulator n=1 Tax=unclassified Roseivivax TaxID=2639302 RepID=UPI001268641F|nr:MULTISPECIES: response regulator [unclassified Roseivivax]QFS81307.1 KDP operon transcriptional regulatory protein KdpE [Roseivivax sp. THAF197b]QFT45036.1 KDP operon transcriptional regulatory protein KdpE [Roseivivax sp. THAF40]